MVCVVGTSVTHLSLRFIKLVTPSTLPLKYKWICENKGDVSGYGTPTLAAWFALTAVMG